jgi:hypothetical protein
MSRWTGTLLALMMAGGGCIGPAETQFLSCYPRRPDVEARSYDWHDPFPEERIGPDTATRPRSFVEPRSDSRKQFDLRFFEAHHPSASRASLVRNRPLPPWNGQAPVVASPLPSYPYPTHPHAAAPPVLLPY